MYVSTITVSVVVCEGLYIASKILHDFNIYELERECMFNHKYTSKPHTHTIHHIN